MADHDRLEREIEEILGKIEDFPTPEPRYKATSRHALRRLGGAISERHRAITARVAQISMSQVMLLAFLLILGSFFFRRMNPMLMNWVLYLGIILFVTAFAIMVFGRRGSGGRSSSDARWRGREVEYQSRRAQGQRGPTLAQRLRLWFSRRGKRTRH
jgi:hypothetical protein